jgi:hypothetical protein
VLLGAGGFERNQEMRDQYLNKPTKAEWTATPVEAIPVMLTGPVRPWARSWR